MKIFEVIYSNVHQELQKRTKSLVHKDNYHEKDGKVCMYVKEVKVTRRTLVKTYSEDTIKKTFAERKKESPNYELISTKFIKEEESIWEKLVDENYYREILSHGGERIKSEVIKENISVPCADSVQEDFQRHGEKWWNMLIPMDDHHYAAY